MGDTAKQSKVTNSSLETVHEIVKLIKRSPKREAMFNALKQELATDTPGIRVLCPTRWTVRAVSLQSTLEKSKEYPLNTYIKIRIIGVEAQMSTSSFLFGVSLGAVILTHSDNLSKTLQHQLISATEGQHVARLTLNVLKSIRQPENFYCADYL